MMRLSLLGAALVALALPASAQTQTPDMRATAHPQSDYVVPHGPGEAVRVTTYARRPTMGERLDRYRGVRVFRGPSVPRAVVAGTPTAPVVRTPDGAFVQQGGARFPVGRR